MDWDSFQYVLAIARHGSLAKAAQHLGVDQSTLYRRLDSIEKTLNVRVFERQRSGYHLTPEGETLAEAAERIETEALAAERHVLGTDSRLTGTIRVSTSEPLGLFLLPPMLGRFSDAYPQVQIQLAVTNQLADLSKRDADVVVRITADPPEHLVGRRAAALTFSAYASHGYIARHGLKPSLAEYDWLGYDDTLARGVAARWVKENLPDVIPRIRSDSVAALYYSARAGLGVTILPCFMAKKDPELVRLGAIETAGNYGIWVLTHPDLRRSARIRAFTRSIGDWIGAEQESFSC
jgi:DNA-binding transcriptional LysR family regulator